MSARRSNAVPLVLRLWGMGAVFLALAWLAWFAHFLPRRCVRLVECLCRWSDEAEIAYLVLRMEAKLQRERNQAARRR